MRGTSREGLPPLIRQDGDTFIVLAVGALDELPSHLGRIGCKRAYVVTGSSLASGPVAKRMLDVLGPVAVGLYSGSRPHVPIDTVTQVAGEARSLKADVLIGLGGGSPIGTAKAAAFHLASDGERSRPGPVVAAIPTTYSGSEVTPVFGTTDVAKGRKDVVRNPGIRPRLSLYDPELALDTPPDLTAGTGINALAHCVEGSYSNDAGDEERAMAIRAAGLLVEHLPKAVDRPKNLAHRYYLFEGSMLAGLVLARAGMGVHHGLCHVLGGRYNAPHGVLNAIVLPHAMRFNIPVAQSTYRQLAPIFGLTATESPAIGEAVCQATADFIRPFRLPTRLRELGIAKADLSGVAEEAMQSQSVRRNPRPLRGPQDALEILEAAW